MDSIGGFSSCIIDMPPDSLGVALLKETCHKLQNRGGVSGWPSRESQDACLLEEYFGKSCIGPLRAALFVLWFVNYRYVCAQLHVLHPWRRNLRAEMFWTSDFVHRQAYE
eukprot:4553521-Amphidinium_carterae.1